MRSAADAAPSHLHVPDLAHAGDTFLLSEEESRYLARVCRARPGDLATATDGAGLECRVRVRAIAARVDVAVESRRDVPRRADAWVLCGAPEGQRADWLVEKLGELGVARLVPVDADRGGWSARGDKLERLRRLAVAALRQSRRAWLIDVASPAPLDAALEGIPAEARRWLADPAHGPETPASDRPAAPVEVVAIGPAGGFSQAEIDSILGRGFAPICLADARLRTETAAVAWAADWSVRSLGAGSFSPGRRGGP
jgi:16S rRNA (uracil1498-N3)-methyltransferase